ncbi:DMT family transporter [Serratia marcescens]|uniref:DMT family transporter n=1 Tax=Serratia marcescens TaxID=615 RepID=UPI00301E4BB6
MKKLSVGELFTFSLFAAVSITWGTTWLAMKIAVETIPPFFATGLRFLFASPFLIAIAIFYNKPLLFPKGSRLFQILVCVFYFAIPFSLMIYGEESVSSSMASIIFSFMPVAIFITSYIMINERNSTIQFIGVLISMFSLVSIITHEIGSIGPQSWHGVVALVVAVTLHAIMYVQTKKRCLSLSVFTYNAIPCLGAGFLLTIFGYYFEGVNVNHFSEISIISVAYLGVVSGVFGIVAYFQLQKRVKPFHASSVFFVFPVIAIFLEDFVTGKAVSIITLVLFSLLLAGIALVLIPVDSLIVRRHYISSPERDNRK